ncbi:hypothetical protein HDU67_006018 [Dinochytrium kinnereticum]|nr:hypothetical protein HDU67_006018 [Dinochytrium kinnereticum]
MSTTATLTAPYGAEKPANTNGSATPKPKPLTPKPITLKDIRWLHVGLLFGTPIIGLYGLLTVPLMWKTFILSVTWYFLTGFGITGGYHRYWSHRSYDASRPFQYFLMLIASGAFEGSIRWWCRDHRAHHRFTDTPRDPYGAQNGLFWSHIGWMLVKQDKKEIGRVDISDLNRDPMIMWQHKNYVWVASFMAFVLPTLVAGFGWGDWAGGYFYAGVLRLVFVHHATFCVNSLAHYLGETSFDDKHSPRDHFITAIVTLGEGYHNFHHEFPSDYRNAIQWYQYDPTKWSIWLASLVGWTRDLKEFPENEIVKGRVMMQQKKIDEVKKRLDWGVDVETLKVVGFEEVTREIEQTGRQLIIIDKIVYDVTKFMDDHPGGRGFLKAGVGRDMTEAFNGAIYDHSNAARNLMSHLRYARFRGDVPDDFKSKEE